MFVGRKQELRLLEESYAFDKGSIIVMYGRRRIGKSTLIQEFVKNKEHSFYFEGIESGNTKAQILHFTAALRKMVKDPVLDSVVFSNWDQVFTYFTDRVVNSLHEKKLILVLDEIQWLAAGRKTLIAMIKYYWDNFWKEKKVKLILCGSIASFMVENVIKSNALYGRIDLEILLKGLKPSESLSFFSERKSKDEILKYLLVMGSVPKYLEFINQKKSFNKNINDLFFSKTGRMNNEIEKIFYSQFKESSVYRNIVNLLQKSVLGFDEISKLLNMPSGGGLKRYLENLENAEIIVSFIPYNKKAGTKIKKYALSDEYLRFYFKYIEPNKEIISQSDSEILFETLTKNSFEKWMGIQFERFCLKNKNLLAEKMGFKNQVLIAAPFYEKGDTSFQIDLLFVRSDNVITICEIKYWNSEIGTKIISEMKKKTELLKNTKGYSIETALITTFGADKSLKETNYFDHILTMDDIFS